MYLHRIAGKKKYVSLVFRNDFYSMTRIQRFARPTRRRSAHYTILATVMNPVGLALRFLGTGAIVVVSLAGSSGSVSGIGAVSGCPVRVDTAVPSFVDVGALAVAVAMSALIDRVMNVVCAAAVPRSMSSLIMTRIS